MNIGKPIGSVQLAQQHPQGIRPFAAYARHHFLHSLVKRFNGRVSAPEQISREH